ncbi:DNA sulfur modification protein DndB [Streptomyces sp. NPDC096030]|uniref:DNA sulfur modification protein DndB n=1 Tax=Streptomyces sp. NPDC096030 TaxID=3155423 RepID=UPI00332B15E8
MTEIDRGRGDPLRILELGPNRALTTMPWGVLSRIVPDPRKAENPHARRHLSAREMRQVDARNDVQRKIKSTKKAENAKAYARYLAEAIKGEREERWATPPFALWLEDGLDIVQARSFFGTDKVAYLPYEAIGVLVDAETQHLAHWLLYDDPVAFGLTAAQVSGRIVGVELYHGIDIVAARQTFHDRNLLGVVPNKNVALAADSMNVATNIATTLLKEVQVINPVSGTLVPLKEMVSAGQRQLKASDPEWMTLSTLRSFVVAAVFGKAGFEKTSGSIADLPAGCDRQAALREIADALTRIFAAFGPAFRARTSTVIASPAVFAALGAVVHRAMSWSDPADSLTIDDVMKLLADVRWERDPKYWEGTAGRLTSSGSFSLAGGVKDNASKITAALSEAQSPRYLAVRHGSVRLVAT